MCELLLKVKITKCELLLKVKHYQVRVVKG